MSKITVKAGKTELTLRKSQKYVGIKTKESELVAKSIESDEDVNSKIHENLGGFQIVTLKRSSRRVSLDEKLDEVRKKDSVEVGTHVYYSEKSRKPIVATGDIYIIFADGTDKSEQQMVLDEYALKVVANKGENRIVARVTDKSPNPLKVAAYLQDISLVKLAEPDLDSIVDEYMPVAAPTDGLFKHEWHLRNEGVIIDANWRIKKGADAKVIDAWDRLGNMGSKDITIAVIDNGFDLSHPDLKDRVVHQYDLWTNSKNVLQGDPTYTHGTPCASVALARSNGSGIVGAAPNAKFMPISGTSFGWQATEKMFQHCIDNGADVISCSWGTTESQFALNALKAEAIAKAAREGRNGKGAVICYAAGNEGLDYVNYYSAHPDVICVGASTSKDEHATYSNRGREVTIVAPSNGDWPITASRASWDNGVSWEVGAYRYWWDGIDRSAHHKHFGGTSSATPLVAGICALMLTANPDLTAKDVKQILIDTADKIGDPLEYNTEGHSLKYGYGRVNADKAVKEALRLKDTGGIPEEVEEDIKKGRGIFRFNVEKKKPEGFGVQIGAFAEYGNVLIQVEKLQSAFKQPIIVSINELDGQTVYKVVVGDFDDKSDASRLKKVMKEAGVKGFVRNIKDLA